jgi:hypothetical protein
VKGERFAEQERRLIETGELLHHNIKGMSRSLEGDKLITMIRESSGIREKNLEQMVRNGEEKSELYLERHIRD